MTSFSVTDQCKCTCKFFLYNGFPDTVNYITLNLRLVICWPLNYSYYLSRVRSKIILTDSNTIQDYFEKFKAFQGPIKTLHAHRTGARVTDLREPVGVEHLLPSNFLPHVHHSGHVQWSGRVIWLDRHTLTNLNLCHHSNWSVQ